MLATMPAFEGTESKELKRVFENIELHFVLEEVESSLRPAFESMELKLVFAENSKGLSWTVLEGVENRVLKDVAVVPRSKTSTLRTPPLLLVLLSLPLYLMLCVTCLVFSLG